MKRKNKKTQRITNNIQNRKSLKKQQIKTNKKDKTHIQK